MNSNMAVIVSSHKCCHICYALDYSHGKFQLIIIPVKDDIVAET